MTDEELKVKEDKLKERLKSIAEIEKTNTSSPFSFSLERNRRMGRN